MGEQFPRMMIESVRREFFVEFLEPWRAHCAARGLGSDHLRALARDEFVERLYRLFNEPDPERPANLVAAIDAIVHLSEDDRNDHVQASLTKHAPETEPVQIPPGLTTTELALWAYERYPRAFANAVRRKQRASKQPFHEYLPRDRRSLMEHATEERRQALRDRLRVRHGALGHTKYAGVRFYDNDFETRIFWIHGRSAEAQGIIEDDEKRALQHVIRERCDLTIIDRLTGRLSVNALNPAQVWFLRDALGDVFFGDGAHYHRNDIYSGAPLIEQGQRALSVDGIRALQRVQLRSLTIGEREGDDETWRSKSCLFLTRPSRMRELQLMPGVTVLRMRLAVQYAACDREKTVEITMPNHIEVDRRVGEPSLREFLVTRGFADYGDGFDNWRLAA
jgi:hypothetical protein